MKETKSKVVHLCVFPDEGQRPVHPHAAVWREHQAHTLFTQNPLSLTALSPGYGAEEEEGPGLSW